MPSADRAVLFGAAQQLGVALTPAQAEQLFGYLALLSKWNQAFSLTSVRDPAAMLVHHVIDSLAVVPAARRRPGVSTLLDVGSGAGLPGAIIAIAMPEVEVTCVDSVGKKAAFIRQVAGELGIASLKAVHSRVETMDGQFDIVAARAFSALAVLVSLSHERLATGGAWMAMKGRVPRSEIAELPMDVRVFHVERLTVPGLSAERCLVWIEKTPSRT